MLALKARMREAHHAARLLDDLNRMEAQLRPRFPGY
jgi:hypothetical protein